MKTKEFQSRLEAALKRAGLPTDPLEIVGKKYRFGCEYHLHHTVLVGTIEAIELTYGGALELYVSSPKFWGGTLISFQYREGAWIAISGGGDAMAGEFVLL